MITNRHGHSLIKIIPGIESELLRCHSPITASMVIANYQGKVLIGFNRSRNQWEAPAGRVEKGETLRECAKREFLEESCQVAGQLQFLALAKIQRASGEEKFSAVYATSLDRLITFKSNLEWERIDFWDINTDVFPMDSVDVEIIRACVQIV